MPQWRNWFLLALDLTIVLENRRVLECGQECFLVSPTISYLLLQSKAVITACSLLCPLLSILCSAILLNAMHIGDCYRDLPLRPACCRNPLVSSSSRQMKKRSTSTLSSTSSTCGSFRSCGSVLPPCAILMSGEWISQDAWCLCATFCYAWCLRNWCLRQHQPVSTLLQGKYKGIAETCQMTMNYVLLRWARLFFRDERGYSQQRRITISMIKADLIETEKHGRLLSCRRYSVIVHFGGTWIVCSSSLEGSHDVSFQMG